MIQKVLVSLWLSLFSVCVLPEEHGVILQQFFHFSSAAHCSHIHDFSLRKFISGHMQVSVHSMTVDLSQHASSFSLGWAHRLLAGYVTPRHYGYVRETWICTRGSLFNGWSSGILQQGLWSTRAYVRRLRCLCAVAIDCYIILLQQGVFMLSISSAEDVWIVQTEYEQQDVML